MLTGDEKREWLRARAHECRLPWFIETGSSEGYTPAALSPDFERLLSIELDYDNYLLAVRNNLLHRNVSILHGDSAFVLQQIMPLIDHNTMFFLDAHYNGKTPDVNPVPYELAHIFYGKRPHWVFIDDARLFGDDPTYPTLDWIARFLHFEHEYGHAYYSMAIVDDIICLRPQ